jgi:hypothetical protein
VVARSASDTPGFSPIERPRVSIANDGTLAAIAESTRVVVVEVPSGAPFAEIGVDSEALVTEVAWIGAPPRLLVMSRYASHSTVHLVDPHGPRTISEIRLEPPMRLFSTVGPHALAVGAMGAAMMTAGEAHLTPYQFPARTIPATGGAAGNNFVVALAGSVEEWDPAARMPRRRLRLPRPAVITNLGGSERAVWMTTQQDPTRIDVIPLVNRGQPKQHELPEPIAHVTGHPRSDLLVCVGADSGKIYVVDLDGRSRLRVLGPEGIDRTEAAGLVVGRMIGVLAAQAGRPITVVTLDGREVEDAPMVPVPAVLEPEEPKRRSTLSDDDEPTVAPAAVAPAAVAPAAVAPAAVAPAAVAPAAVAPAAVAPAAVAPAAVAPAAVAPAVLPEQVLATPPPTMIIQSPAQAPSLFRHPTIAPTPAPARPAAKAPTTVGAQNLADRFSSWRDKQRSSQPRSESAGAMPWIDPRPTWRDEAVTWSRAVVAGSVDRGAPSCPPIDALAVRFELAANLVPALVLLYGAHLSGERGVAPIDISRVLGRRWNEALGRGDLAERGLAVYHDSRVRLAPPIQRVLDELPISTGTLVGDAGTVALLGPCVVVAGDESLVAIAERCLASVGGAILAASDDVDPEELFTEARARGAAPMLRITNRDIEPGNDPAIFVVSDPVVAERLGIPRLG